MLAMMTERDNSWRSQEENGRVAKRQKGIADSLGNSVDQFGEYYDDISSGRIDGEIRHSWLRQKYRVTAESSYEFSTVVAGDLSSTIQQLQKQLIQTKRRLWPAAERCGLTYDTSPNKEFSEARSICNPMEPLGEGRKGGLNQMFMNRSAIKLANIDAILDFALTETKVENFFFVDLAGAPGGFSEVRKCCHFLKCAAVFSHGWSTLDFCRTLVSYQEVSGDTGNRIMQGLRDVVGRVQRTWQRDAMENGSYVSAYRRISSRLPCQRGSGRIW